MSPRNPPGRIRAITSGAASTSVMSTRAPAMVASRSCRHSTILSTTCTGSAFSSRHRRASPTFCWSLARSHMRCTSRCAGPMKPCRDRAGSWRLGPAPCRVVLPAEAMPAARVSTASSRRSLFAGMPAQPGGDHRSLADVPRPRTATREGRPPCRLRLLVFGLAAWVIAAGLALTGRAPKIARAIPGLWRLGNPSLGYHDLAGRLASLFDAVRHRAGRSFDSRQRHFGFSASDCPAPSSRFGLAHPRATKPAGSSAPLPVSSVRSASSDCRTRRAFLVAWEIMSLGGAFMILGEDLAPEKGRSCPLHAGFARSRFSRADPRLHSARVSRPTACPSRNSRPPRAKCRKRSSSFVGLAVADWFRSEARLTAILRVVPGCLRRWQAVRPARCFPVSSSTPPFSR